MLWQAVAMVWWSVVLRGNVWAVGPAVLCTAMGLRALLKGK